MKIEINITEKALLDAVIENASLKQEREQIHQSMVYVCDQANHAIAEAEAKANAFIITLTAAMLRRKGPGRPKKEVPVATPKKRGPYRKVKSQEKKPAKKAPKQR